jgi:hypothetical protein
MAATTTPNNATCHQGTAFMSPSKRERLEGRLDTERRLCQMTSVVDDILNATYPILFNELMLVQRGDIISSGKEVKCLGALATQIDTQLITHEIPLELIFLSFRNTF